MSFHLSLRGKGNAENDSCVDSCFLGTNGSNGVGGRRRVGRKLSIRSCCGGHPKTRNCSRRRCNQPARLHGGQCDPREGRPVWNRSWSWRPKGPKEGWPQGQAARG